MKIIEDLIHKERLKKVNISCDIYLKEINIAKGDLNSAEASLAGENCKWATIQAYYAIFHAVRALLYKSGYREESHSALKLAFKELYITSSVLPIAVYHTLERGMNLREMADYKENYSRSAAESLITGVKSALLEINKLIQS